MAVARGASPRRDSVDDFDPNELIGRNQIAHGSPAPARPPRRPSQDSIEFEFEPSSQSTRQLPPEQVEALASMPVEELDDDAVLVDRPPPNWNDGRTQFDGTGAYPGSLDAAVDSQLDDAALGDDIDQGVAAELTGASPDEDLPFDPEEARRFDAGVRQPSVHTDAVYVSGFEETAASDPGHYGADGDPLSISGSYDPYGTESVQTPSYEATTAGSPPIEDPSIAPTPVGTRGESLVEDDLEEADFYASQGMYPEAIEALRILLDRYPNHRMILAKLHELEALARSADPEQAIDTPPSGQDGHLDHHGMIEHTGGTDALDLEEIEEVSVDELEEIDEGGRVVKKRKPTVMLEKPVDEGDADTHYDLGLAYKEMGLYDEAIKAFEKVLRAPNREVQCRVMLGMCQREQGNPNEAIHEFKQGLHANATDRERLSLYYEIGITYESMGDNGEALYYFESVLKRDPNFADAGQRAQELRAHGGKATSPAEDDL
jgi:hypothetical protein